MTHLEERVLARVLWSVWFEGKAVTLEQLVAGLAADSDVEGCVERLVSDGLLEWDRFGRRIYGVRGITLVPTDHTLAVERRTLYARSFEAAVKMMAALEESGTLSTPCPGCGRELAVRFVRGKVCNRRSWFRDRKGWLHDRRCGFRI